MARQDIWWKISTVLSSPSAFFRAVRPESGVGPAFTYLALIQLVPAAVIALMALFIAPLLADFLGPLALLALPMLALGIGIVIIVYVAGLAGSFVGAAVIHLFALIFGVKGSYPQTYKALAYGSTPSSLLGWIPILNIIVALWTIYLDIRGLSILHSVSMGRAAAILLIPVVVIAGIITVALTYAVLAGSFLPAAGG